MKPATEILLSAAFVLTPKENWTKGVCARDAKGREVNTDAPEARCFCVVGSFLATMDECGFGVEDYDAACDTFSRAMGSYCWAGDLNDTHTHAEVLDAIYKAAELSEAP